MMPPLCMFIKIRPLISVLRCLCFLLFVSSLSADLRFYEVVSSNGGSFVDPDGDTGDWLEIRNDGDELIVLEGWGLSDRPDQPFRWTFPNVILGPDELLLVWADGKDMHSALSSTRPRLHTNFSISAVGESLVLTRPDGSLADRLDVPPLPRNISYGRQGGEWYYFDEPTPWDRNTTTGYMGILEPVTFSYSPGQYDESITLQLEHPDPNVEIRYSLDLEQA